MEGRSMTADAELELARRRVYRNPPISEAIVEFTFEGDSKWNLTSPGRLYDLFSDDYPEEPKERQVFQANVAHNDDQKGLNFEVNQRPDRIVFANGNRLLMAGNGVLSVHCNAPYEGWKSFEARAMLALAAYSEAVKQTNISRIALRYVNRIPLPSPTIEFEDYFTIAQGLPVPGFPSKLTSFMDRMVLEYEDAPIRIIFTWGLRAQARVTQTRGHSSYWISTFNGTRGQMSLTRKSS